MCSQRCFHEKPRELRRACKCWDDPAASAPRGRRWRLDGFVSMQSSPEKIGERHFTWPSNDLNLYAARPRIIQVRYIENTFHQFSSTYIPSICRPLHFGASTSARKLSVELLTRLFGTFLMARAPSWQVAPRVRRPYDVPLHWLVCWDPYIGL